MAENRPGKGFLGWLGRQVGYVTKAVKTDVGGPKTVYRDETVEEQPLPDDPNIVLRRTTRDEVIIKGEESGVRNQESVKARRPSDS